MREFVSLICKVKEDKNNFNLLIEKMEPLVKFIKTIYKSNKKNALKTDFK